MVAPLPHGELVKLVDFGIARRIDATASPAPVQHRVETSEPWRFTGETSATGPYLFGTPGYMAPEVIQGTAPTCAADVYAAGVVLYRLLTGKRPFAGNTAEEIFARQLDSYPTSPSMLRAHVPAALEAITMRALARAPEDRYANGTELRRVVEAVAVALVPHVTPSALRLHTGTTLGVFCRDVSTNIRA
jgi:serine/threonine-protein kinase